MGHVVGYIRVSSVGQNTERQLDGITTDKIFTDKASGKDTNRPHLQAALEHCREGDTFIVHSIDRLARSLGDLEKIVERLTAKGVTVKFCKEGLTFTGDKADPINPITNRRPADFWQPLLCKLLIQLVNLHHQGINSRISSNRRPCHYAASCRTGARLFNNASNSSAYHCASFIRAS
ncbi:hypothetical protein GCM10027046_33340 [Uliginosibacterium flavum]|uniref:Recombinase family protein n=1 Tax=Uliginosibacterium flavum TaxID=1396831 RepID=A0ABV2TPS9_9RHOO